MVLSHLIPFLVSFAISIVLTPVVRGIVLSKGYVAKPRKDRWHKKDTALFGGIAIFVSFLASYLLFAELSIYNLGIVLCGTIIFGLGLFDDVFHIKPHTKLIGQIVVASLLVTFGVQIRIIPYHIISFPLTIIWVVAIINAFNLLDNMDGLSCGVAAIVSGVLFICSIFNGGYVWLPALILTGSLLGFLRYNFSPAKIFMGDAGSMFIGFMLATMTLQESWKESTNLVMIVAIPVFLLAVPLLDTTFVTLARGLASRRVFQGGKDHISHRMVVLGLSEKKTVLVLYFISLFFGGVSVLSIFVQPMVTAMLVLLVAVVLVYFAAFLGKVKVYTDTEVKKLNKRSGRTILGGILMHKRRLLEVGLDFILICIAYITAYLLRFEGVLSPATQALIVKSLPLVVIIKYLVFFKFGLYRGIWRYVSISDLITIFKAVLSASLASSLAVLFIWRFEGFSRAVFIIDWLLLFVFISGARVLERIYKELFDQVRLSGKRILIYGAGDAGEFILREIKNNDFLHYKPVGFLDDDEEKKGRYIHGLPVLGARDDIPHLIKYKQIDEIILAMPKISDDTIGDIVGFCKALNINCRRMQDILPK